MKTAELVDTYFQKAQHYAVNAKQNSAALQDLLQLIDNEKDNAHHDPAYDEFLKGEHEFYSGKYQHALKHYLRAKSIPYFKLCCYRTSAYVSKARGDNAKALTFAKEALEVSQNDFPSLIILAELLTLNQQREEAQKIQFKIEALQAEHYVPQTTSRPASSINNTASSTETAMHTPSGFITSVESQPSETTDLLTQRLYAPSPYLNKNTPFSRSGSSPIDTDDYTHTSPTIDVHHQPSSTSSKEESPLTESLETAIKSFQKRQEACVAHYLDQLKRRPHRNDHALYVLHGYPSHAHDLPPDHSLTTELLLAGKERSTSGGYYIRWNGKGIVINPGTHFLEHFHRQGLHIRDIDYVIVTNSNPDSYTDIKEIYELHFQLNNVDSHLQIINYYLCQPAFQVLAPTLKPHFKQERDTVHCLELFLDSPDVEKVDLGHDIVLNYFPASAQIVSRGSNIALAPSCLGIRLDLRSKGDPLEEQTVRLGYISGTPWSPLHAHHLEHCDVLIAGFGNTNAGDYNKTKYNELSLGYFGSYTLLEEVHPHLFIASEFNGNQGDIRLEVIKLMRQEYTQTYPNARHVPAIVPADASLLIDLRSLSIQCSLTKSLVTASHAHIVKSQASFGSLRYLSPTCCI